MLLQQLEQIGLSEKEAKVYLTLLRLGEASVNEISQESEVNRSSTYLCLDSLEEQTLIKSSGKKGVKKYIALSPERLVEITENKVKRDLDTQKSISETFPQLRALYKGNKKKPRVLFYEGTQGMINAYEDIFSEDIKGYRAFSSQTNLNSDLKKYIKEHKQKRIEKGISVRRITSEAKIEKDINDKNSEHLHIPKSKYNLTSDVGIYGDRVAFVSPKDKFAVIIENEAIVDVIKKSFDLAWAEAKRLDAEQVAIGERHLKN